MLKIAYIVLAHTCPEHIARLSKKLTAGTVHEVFIHIDAKSDEQPFRDLLINEACVHFVKERVEVFWAGFSSIVATINSFKEALAEDSFDRFVILQGLDYPIRSNKEIDDFFVKNKGVEFVRAINETHCKDIKTRHKYQLYWFLGSRGLWQKIMNHISDKLLKYKIIIPFKKTQCRVGEKTFEIYRGWAHMALTGNAVSYIVDFYDNNHKYNKYFMSVFAPDESYFHTIIYNSEFRFATPEKGPTEERSISAFLNVTYFEYPVEVTLFTKVEDYKKLYDSNFLFFRKASIESKELLDYIDKVHNTDQDQEATGYLQ